MQTTPDIIALNESIKNESAFITLIQNELSKVIIGQQGMVEGLLIGLLADGHVLLEGVPGLAKTLAINSLSQTIALHSLGSVYARFVTVRYHRHTDLQHE